MKTLLFPLLAISVLAGTGCNDGNFISNSRTQPARNSDSQNPHEFDSERGGPGDQDNSSDGTDGNHDQGGPGGDVGSTKTPPTPGEGHVERHNFQVDCQSSQGKIITIDGSSQTKLTLLDDLKGDQDTPLDDKSDKQIPPEDTPEEKDPTPPQNDAHVMTSVKGQFCPTSPQEKLKVLLVIDQSASMGPANRDSKSGVPAAGNDPLINGSCQRLEAAKVIIEQLKGHEQVEVAMIGFASKVTATMKFATAQDFASQMKAEVFCKSIRPKNSRYNTSYAVALGAAEQALKANYGRKVIYFITDGRPTVGTQGAQGLEVGAIAGIAAGKKLRTEVDNLQLNGLLLGASGQSKTLEILTKTIGNPARVRHALQARDLPTEITEFPQPEIDLSSIEASLFVDGVGKKPLAVKSFAETAPMIWSYETVEFELLGTPGVFTDNQVIVTAKDINGETFQSQITLRYKR